MLVSRVAYIGLDYIRDFTLFHKELFLSFPLYNNETTNETIMVAFEFTCQRESLCNFDCLSVCISRRALKIYPFEIFDHFFQVVLRNLLTLVFKQYQGRR